MGAEGSLERGAALDHLWDRVSCGQDGGTELRDSADLAAIRAIHANTQRPEPSPAFARRLREDLMHAAPLDTISDDLMRPGLHGRRGGSPLPLLALVHPFPREQRWSISLATAALVLLVILGSYLAFGGPLPGKTPEEPAILPALEATPSVESTPVVIEQTWETQGEVDDPLDAPFGMTFAPDGTLWVADANKNRFQLFAPDGAFLETWGTSGSGDGEFNFLASDHATKGTPGGYGDIAFAPDGTFYVADTGNFRIQQFGPDRAFIRAWGSEGTADGQFINAMSVAIGPDGSVYVADENRDDVQRFDADGQFLNSIGGVDAGEDRLTYPVAVTVDPQGVVWVANFSQPADIARFSPDGEPLGPWEHDTSQGTLRAPLDVAIDPEGRVWVADMFRAQALVFAPDGSFVAKLRHAPTEARSGGFLNPAGIAVNDDGQAVVGDWFGDFITAFQVR